MKSEYGVAAGGDLHGVASAVNAMIGGGWSPHGSMVVAYHDNLLNPIQFIQPMIRTSEGKPSSSHLLDAAPGLLAACKALIVGIESVMDIPGVPDAINMPVTEWNLAKASVARAEGK
jgi:hypothetical protein